MPGKRGTPEERFLAKLNPVPNENGCHLWMGAKNSQGGYGNFWDGENYINAHRYQFKRLHGYLPPVVRHTCDTPLCCTNEHLVGGTTLDNVRDKMERMRQQIGSARPEAKLDEESVLLYRHWYAEGRFNTTQLSEIADVARHAMAQALEGDTWKHVGGPLKLKSHIVGRPKGS